MGEVGGHRGHVLGQREAFRMVLDGVRTVAAIRHAMEAMPLPADLPVMAITQDHLIDAPWGEIPLRVHRPTRDEHASVLVYFHGGGMCLGSNHSFEPLARHLAHHSGATVVSVGYHLAPESPPGPATRPLLARHRPPWHCHPGRRRKPAPTTAPASARFRLARITAFGHIAPQAWKVP
ncbi:alpha/beta hydrolase fold domain-containing protein [Microtetraspora niveoalba]|uniref:alpha/beta hydrolase fold domain-containing protein n=1 Tax=Microtetraspora niveoalba TaxID=46175 RepID=UPI001C3F3BE2|nr:alpha/beta hydrolase fold domain-containing protein [Microtetraspora niveoalba]